MQTGRLPTDTPSHSLVRRNAAQTNLRRVQLARLGMFQSHEMIDHPLAAIYAVAFTPEATAAATSAIALLQRHLKPSDDNSSYSQAMASKTVFPLWHPEFPRHFVVLVDTQQCTPSAAEIDACVAAVLKSATAAVGNDGVVRVSAVEVNGGTGSKGEAGTHVDWLRHRHSNLSCPGRHRVVACAGEAFQHVQMEQASARARGGWLTQQNLDDLVAFVSAFLRARLAAQAAYVCCGSDQC